VEHGCQYRHVVYENQEAYSYSDQVSSDFEAGSDGHLLLSDGLCKHPQKQEKERQQWVVASR